MKTLILGLGFVSINISRELAFTTNLILTRRPKSTVRERFLKIARDKLNLQVMETSELTVDTLIDAFLKCNPDVVINCVGKLQGTYPELYESNVEIVHRVVEACRRYVSTTEKDVLLVHVSTAYIVGKGCNITYVEEEPYLNPEVIKPELDYEKTKCEGEKMLREYLTERVHVVVLRPVMMLGDYCYHELNNTFFTIVQKLRTVPKVKLTLQVLDVSCLARVVSQIVRDDRIWESTFTYMYVPSVDFTLEEILTTCAEVLQVKVRKVFTPSSKRLLMMAARAYVKEGSKFLKYLNTRFSSKVLYRYVDESAIKFDLRSCLERQIKTLRELKHG